jgi:hypothetical protein
MMGGSLSNIHLFNRDTDMHMSRRQSSSEADRLVATPLSAGSFIPREEQRNDNVQVHTCKCIYTCMDYIYIYIYV